MVKPYSFLLMIKALWIGIADTFNDGPDSSMGRAKPNAKYEKNKERYFPRDRNDIKVNCLGKSLQHDPKSNIC